MYKGEIVAYLNLNNFKCNLYQDVSNKHYYQ